MKTIFNTLIHKDMQIKTTLKFHLDILVRMAKKRKKKKRKEEEERRKEEEEEEARMWGRGGELLYTVG
jgi:hypothetical protein